MGNYEVVEETPKTPNLRVGFGLQGIATGNPGYYATSEKNVALGSGFLNGFLGVGFRTNENHAHLLGGLKYSLSGWTLGIQSDGHKTYPFLNYQLGATSVGFYLIDFKKPAYALSIRF